MNKENKFKQDQEYRIYRILHLAKKHGWRLVKEHVELHKLEFLNTDHRDQFSLAYLILTMQDIKIKQINDILYTDMIKYHRHLK